MNNFKDMSLRMMRKLLIGVGIFLAVVIATLILLANNSVPPKTVWSIDVPSPNGEWIAHGETITMGDAAPTRFTDTTVILKSVPPASREEKVFYATGRIRVKLEWLTPTRLQVTYSTPPRGKFGFSGCAYYWRHRNYLSYGGRACAVDSHMTALFYAGA
jgi:hypothetical protein